MVMYLSTFTVSVYGIVLFGFEWWRKRQASSVFIYVFFILVGIAHNYGTSMVMRYLYLTDRKEWIEFLLNSIWWPMRCVILFVALVCIVGHMTVRIVRNK